jgi:hypothetical protein
MLLQEAELMIVPDFGHARYSYCCSAEAHRARKLST